MRDTNPRTIDERIAHELDALRAQSQFRTLDTPGGVNLNSNDYLGLASDPRLKRAVLDAVAHATTVGSTGSRLLSGNAREWEEAERSFAQFAGTEAALYFGSGYAANVGLLTSILKPDDMVFSDALNHASLIDGIRLSGAAKVIYPHCDLSFLESVLREHAGDAGAKVIVTETVFSMEGDVAPMDGLLSLARKYGAALVLDEAHATGVLGPKGRGVAAEHDCEREILASVHTCGKALASAGAFVCGGNALKDYLDQPGAYVHFQHRDATVFRRVRFRRRLIWLAKRMPNARIYARSPLPCARNFPREGLTAGRARPTSCR